MPERMVRVYGPNSRGKSIPNVWNSNSKGLPSELSPDSSNDSSSGGCGTKLPPSTDGVELDEVGEIHWTPL